MTNMLLAAFAALLILDVSLANAGKEQQPKRLYDFGLGKRAAYTYLSEYKRLPIYNFGLGKRSGDRNAFPSWLARRENDIDLEYDDDDVKDDFKRMKQYSFGLGKRLPLRTYSFGLGKRTYDYGDSFLEDDLEEAKRIDPNGHRFSFGLGKREEGKQELPGRRNSMQYSFGLGKRSHEEESSPNIS